MISKKKKIVGTILIALLICGIFASNRVYAADSDFTIENGVLTKYKGSSSSVKIPNGVRAIGEFAFYQCEVVTEIVIPDGVTEIKADAFARCKNLSNIVIPESVTTIGSQAFFQCESLTAIKIPESVTTIGKDTFYQCKSLKTVKIPESVTTLEQHTFDGCTALTDIYIPKGITQIGEYAFYDTTWLEQQRAESSNFLVIVNDILIDGHKATGNVQVPDTVKKIANRTFYDNKNITAVTLGRNVTMIGDRVFYRCENLATIKIPESVTTIGASAFSKCKSLSNIIIPKSITTLNQYTFFQCENLTTIKIPESVTTIGASTFSMCKNLSSVVIPKSVTAIGARAFGECESLTTITIPESVTTIGEAAFYQCKSLTAIKIPEGVTTLEQHTFNECTALADIYIPKGITQIGGGALYNTAWIEQQRAESSNSLVIVNDILIDGRKATGNVQVPDTVKKIAGWAFYGNTELTGITLGKITEIEYGAFWKCAGLTEIEISNSVTTIGDRAFGECESLTTITIPESVTTIGEAAFYQCKSLTAIKIPEGVTTLEQHTFNECTALADIYIPKGITQIGGGALYNTAWIEQQRAKSSNSLVIVNDILIDGRKATGNVQVPDTVKKIAGWAFYGNTELTGITLGKITEIEYGAFWKCAGLTEIEISNSVTTIGDTAFAETGLKTITFPENVKEIGCGAILGCPNLEKVTIENETADVIKSDMSNIFGVIGGDNEFVDVQKVVTYKDKNINIVGHKNSTAYKLFWHINIYKDDYGYQTLSFTCIEDVKELLEEVKVTSTLTIRKGKRGQIKVTLPKGLTEGEEQVKITYKTNKKKVAVINENGKVVGKKRGNAIITTTLSLQDGTKKVFQTKIKVK